MSDLEIRNLHVQINGKEILKGFYPGTFPKEKSMPLWGFKWNRQATSGTIPDGAPIL